MKYTLWLIVIMSLLAMTGCGGEQGRAQKLILGGIDKSNAVRFGEFTRMDDKHACYEIHVRNFAGHEQTAYALLTKEKAEDPQWSSWTANDSLAACRQGL